MFIMMVIASIAALMSLEAKDIERREAKKG
jgi:hypothetical protein